LEIEPRRCGKRRPLVREDRTVIGSSSVRQAVALEPTPAHTAANLAKLSAGTRNVPFRHEGLWRSSVQVIMADASEDETVGGDHNELARARTVLDGQRERLRRLFEKSAEMFAQALEQFLDRVGQG
jgi:hypothetical protein